MIKYFTIEDLLKHYLQKKFHTLGIELGERAGIEKINQLYSQLQQLGRLDDILKAIQDNDYRENLFQELEI